MVHDHHVGLSSYYFTLILYFMVICPRKQVTLSLSLCVSVYIMTLYNNRHSKEHGNVYDMPEANESAYYYSPLSWSCSPRSAGIPIPRKVWVGRADTLEWLIPVSVIEGFTRQRSTGFPVSPRTRLAYNWTYCCRTLNGPLDPNATEQSGTWRNFRSWSPNIWTHRWACPPPTRPLSPLSVGSWTHVVRTVRGTVWMSRGSIRTCVRCACPRPHSGSNECRWYCCSCW